MHDVAVTFDGHDVADLHAAVAGDPANVVAAQIDEHDVLGPFLGIGDQFLGQRVSSSSVSPRRSACRRAGGP